MEKVAGVVGIDANPQTQICKFYVAEPNEALKSTLNELAKTNTHMAEMEIVTGLN